MTSEGRLRSVFELAVPHVLLSVACTLYPHIFSRIFFEMYQFEKENQPCVKFSSPKRELYESHEQVEINIRIDHPYCVIFSLPYRSISRSAIDFLQPYLLNTTFQIKGFKFSLPEDFPGAFTKGSIEAKLRVFKLTYHDRITPIKEKKIKEMKITPDDMRTSLREFELLFNDYELILSHDKAIEINLKFSTTLTNHEIEIYMKDCVALYYVRRMRINGRYMEEGKNEIKIQDQDFKIKIVKPIEIPKLPSKLKELLCKFVQELIPLLCHQVYEDAETNYYRYNRGHAKE